METLADGEGSSSFTPDKHCKKTNSRNNCDKSAIRRTMHNFYLTEENAPTKHKIQSAIEADPGWNRGKKKYKKYFKQLRIYMDDKNQTEEKY